MKPVILDGVKYYPIKGVRTSPEMSPCHKCVTRPIWKGVDTGWVFPNGTDTDTDPLCQSLSHSGENSHCPDGYWAVGDKGLAAWTADRLT